MTHSLNRDSTLMNDRGYYVSTYHQMVKFRRAWIRLFNVFLKETGLKRIMIWILQSAGKLLNNSIKKHSE